MPLSIAIAALLALGPLAAGAATVSAAWSAKIGSAGVNGKATISAFTTGTGTIALKLAKLKASTSHAVVLHKGTCGTVGAVLLTLAPIKTNASGAASRTSNLTASQVAKIAAATATGKIAIRFGTGTARKCGLFAPLAITPYVAATITVGAYPAAVAVAPAGVLVSNSPDWTLSRIDPATNQVLSVVTLLLTGKSGATALTYGEGAVWAAVVAYDASDNKLPGSVVRIDATSGQTVATIPVGTDPWDIATSPGAVWVTNYVDGTVIRIDPATNQVVATVTPLGSIIAKALGITPGLGGIAYDFGSVWAASSWDGKISRIDPATNKVTATIATVGDAGGVTTGSGAVWVTNWGTTDQPDGVLSRIDPATNLVVATIPVGINPLMASYAGGYVWVAMRGEKTVVQVNAATNAVKARFTVGGTPWGIAASGHAVWATLPVPRPDPATDAPPGTVTRINY
jgi:YVTN family beta-propeller protein